MLETAASVLRVMQAPPYDACFSTPRDDVYVVARVSPDQSFLTHVDLVPRASNARRTMTAGAALTALSAWLEAYFAAVPTSRCRVPLQSGGTDFQRRVWNQLASIAPGETRSYGAVAHALSSSPRAVGNACRSNPLALVVPCHRVVSATGLGGYSGATSGWKLTVKRWLLEHEQRSLRAQ